ncbi:TIGR03546 family protein [Peredibacter starrii]|uniref:TIGR03546 family protein n=1 Tax=Peredibacter starrii TaxID=28202 RepID=A0AAX4HQR0_9BACT|nr:TIGR03546 family protein [Peredibacter starrii]WPU65691.1 TIGR03546 family protein [Peredibacter starrii]
MGLILKQLFAFIKLLNSDTGNISLALGMTCGFILGMTPVLSLHSLLIFLILFFFRIQIGAALVAAFFFKFIAFLLDPAFDFVGQKVLEMESLQGFFTTLYNMPIIPFTRFNNSIVMGSAVVTFALSPIVFILSQYFIVKYREIVVARFKGTKFWKALQATKFYQWYYKYEQYSWK